MTKKARPTATQSVERLSEELHSLSIRLLRRVRVEDLRSGLSPARLSALSVVVYGGPQTLGELARIEQVRPPTITRLVRGLEAEGLVSLRPHPSDGRSRVVAVTAHGKRVLEAARQRRLAVLQSDLAALSAEELAVVARATTALRSLFGS